MPMTAEEVRSQKCGVCGEPGVLTTKIVTPDGPEYNCFCADHMGEGADYIRGAQQALKGAA